MVGPNLFLLRIMEDTVFLEIFNAASFLRALQTVSLSSGLGFYSDI